MRITLLALLSSLGLISCGRQTMMDADAALNWSLSADAQGRSKAAVYSYQYPDGSWITISTARLTETASGTIYDSGEILKTGYFVYPGSMNATTIQDAIRMAAQIPRGQQVSKN